LIQTCLGPGLAERATIAGLAGLTFITNCAWAVEKTERQKRKTAVKFKRNFFMIFYLTRLRLTKCRMV
jgi:hypothetical protein